MSALPKEERFPNYVGLRPLEYKGIVFGVEKITEIWDELIDLATIEWEQVGDDKRLGAFEPSYELCAAHERNAGMVVVTVRECGQWRLVGYYVATLGRAIKRGGGLVLSEVGLYLTPEYRRGRTALKLLSYIESAAERFGCVGVIVSHRPEHRRVGVMYQRAGYIPLACDYYKELGHD